MAADQIKVKVSRVSTVAPAIPTVKHRMFLSSFDLGLVPYNNMNYLLFYKPTPTTRENEFSVIVENLKRSLSLVLVDFYPLAGRLDLKGGESGRPEVDCNDGGVDFVEASIDMAFQDVENNDFQHKNFFGELVPTRNQNYETSLLSVQVTAFLGGGICIGVRFHHVITDAKSFWHFMECWAERSRGIPISKKPHHMRTVFKRDKQNYTIPNISWTTKQVATDLSKEAYISSFTRDDLLPMKCTSNASEENSANISTIQKSMKEETKLEVASFRFSEKMIKKLKERSGTLSSFVAVAAQFWRCIMKAREVPQEQHVDIEVVADCRGQVKPPLPPTYFGNCVSYGYARTTAKELLEQDIRFAARLIQEAINSCTTEEYINNQIEWCESQLSSRGQVTTENLLGACYIVHTMNSPKLPVYEIDYGWGSPFSVQEVFTYTSNIIGGLMLFPTRGGGITVSTQLPRHQMESLKQILMIIPDWNIRSSL